MEEHPADPAIGKPVDEHPGIGSATETLSSSFTGLITRLMGLNCSHHYPCDGCSCSLGVAIPCRSCDLIRVVGVDIKNALTTLTTALEERDAARQALGALRGLVTTWRYRATSLTSEYNVMRDDYVKARAFRECADELSAALTEQTTEDDLGLLGSAATKGL
jgi:hypothetical protein